MRLLDSTLALCAPGFGLGRRWMREALEDLGIDVPLCDGCVTELVKDADAATRQRLTHASEVSGYLGLLRRELGLRADFVRLWTLSDEPVDPRNDALAPLVRIARKYALPRPWKLSDPVAAPSLRRYPSYRRWASGGDCEALGRS
jgi:hypothetical protein